jgi:DNA recombination protein RmuC
MDLSILMLILTLALVAGLAAGAIFVAVVQSRSRVADAAQRHAAVEAAVASVLAERQATAEAVVGDREKVVSAVVEQAVAMATSQLDAKLQTGSKELDLRSQAFAEQVQHINKGLDQMARMVGELQKERAAQHGALVSELQQTALRSRELHETTAQLREVLASPKARGQWGERMADDVLRAAGFKEGINYRKQTAISGGTIPDFTFLLPGDLELNMDVKFPIDNYVRFVEATEDTSRDVARRQFAKDVRQRVREIADRSYIDPERTVDTVLLFIPNESVYSFLHENDAALLDQALAHKVVLCSPLTLFSVLAIVRQSVDSFRLERRSNEILSYLSGFRGEWSKFSEQVDKVGRHLDTLNNSFDALQGTRRNVMERTLRKVDELQAAEADDVMEVAMASVDPGERPEIGPPLRALRRTS